MHSLLPKNLNLAAAKHFEINWVCMKTHLLQFPPVDLIELCNLLIGLK